MTFLDRLSRESGLDRTAVVMMTGQGNETVAVDATTLEANAAMRSIVRRDTGETYRDYVTRLAEASGIQTPTDEDLRKFDKKRKKKTRIKRKG